MGLEARVDLRKAILLIITCIILMLGLGYAVANKYWLKTDDRNVYEVKIDLLKEQLQKDPFNEQVQLDLAMNEYLDGQTEPAINTYKKILAVHPKNVLAAFYLGLIKVDLKQYQDAVPFLEKVVSNEPSFRKEMLYYNLGVAYLNTNKYQKAVSNLNLAVGIDPGSAMAQYYLGVAYYKSGKYEKAKLSLENALSISGDLGDARRILKQIETRTNRPRILQKLPTNH